MSFSNVIVMATTIVAAILLMVSTAATTELNNGEGESKKAEYMNPTSTAPEGERGLKGSWNNKWKVGDEGFQLHIRHPHFPPLVFPIPFPIPHLHTHDHHVHHVHHPSPSPSPSVPSAKPPAYILP